MPKGGRQLYKIKPSDLHKIIALCGKESSVKVGKMFGVDHTTVIYHWKREKLRSTMPGGKHNNDCKCLFHKIPKPKAQISPPAIIHPTYAQMVKSNNDKIFIRDSVGNLIQVLDKQKSPIEWLKQKQALQVNNPVINS